eukprot:2538152-Pleurochrysis_carterae.AAC.6
MCLAFRSLLSRWRHFAEASNGVPFEGKQISNACTISCRCALLTASYSESLMNRWAGVKGAPGLLIFRLAIAPKTLLAFALAYPSRALSFGPSVAGGADFDSGDVAPSARAGLVLRVATADKKLLADGFETAGATCNHFRCHAPH